VRHRALRPTAGQRRADRRRVGKQDGELAAVAGGKIDVASDLLEEDPTDLAQHLVSDATAGAVVHQLEVVEIGMRSESGMR
jgi:hypothetical protein